MTNNILFSIIGLIMLAIAGVGTVAVIKNPETAKEIPATAISVTKEAISDAVSSVTNIVSSKKDDDDDEDEIEDDDDDDVGTATVPTGTTGGTTQTPPTTSTSGGITMAEVASHNSASSCWSAIGGSVYDLTSFVSKHPGGQAAIKSLCGVDGTTAFQDQHGGQGKPESTLASFKIGTLAQ